MKQAFLVALLVAALCPAGAAAQGPWDVRGEQFVDVAGEPLFLMGVNYEGPADRAWQMWDAGKYDAGLIARDLDRARATGAMVLRVFLQQSLADDIGAGRWAKLDEVVRMAEERGLKLVFTFADYPERSLDRLAALDSDVATRYVGRQGILAYDLKNEPRFGDVALAGYSRGTYVALQDPALVSAVGETIRRAEIPAYRVSEPGRARIPTDLSDDQAYVYANMLAAYLEFLDHAAAWAIAYDSTTVAFLLAPDSTSWDPLKQALNETLATWMQPRIRALRAADPGAIATVGHVDPILASLPANNLLDYRTVHRYPGASTEGIALAADLFRDIRRAVPGKPLVLGEFGFSNVGLAEDRSAVLEVALTQAIRDAGGAGALKWMLNDFPLGFNPRENRFGMFRADGTPKPIAAAFPELAGLAPTTAREPAREPDYAIPSGRFFTQTSGRPPDRDGSGYAVSDADGVPFWETWRALGVENIGYPLSPRFEWRGATSQVFQKAILQWRPGEGVGQINLLDDLHQLGFDPWLEAQALVPHPRDTAADTAETWEELVQDRLALLDTHPELRAKYMSARDPIFQYGLPTSEPVDMGDVVTVRTQRSALQLWKVDVPWAAAGQVTVLNSGELAKELELIPIAALVPEPAPVIGTLP